MLDFVVEADSIALQLKVVEETGAYALLGPYAFEEALRNGRVQAATLTDPEVPRYVALATAPHGELSLACRTVMRELQAISDRGTAAPALAKRVSSVGIAN